MFFFSRKKKSQVPDPPDELKGVLAGEKWQKLKQGASLTINGWSVKLRYVDDTRGLPYLIVCTTSAVHCLYGPNGFTKWVHVFAWLRILAWDVAFFEELRKKHNSRCMELIIDKGELRG